MVQDFVCLRCGRKMIVVREMVLVGVVCWWWMKVLEKVQQFCYLGDVLDCETEMERAVRMRMAAAW